MRTMHCRPVPTHLGEFQHLSETEGDGIGPSELLMAAGGAAILLSTATSEPIKTVALVGGVGLLGLGLLRLLALPGVGGSGNGTTVVSPKRPFEVMIADHTYLVDGEETALVTVVALAREVPAGGGPDVIIWATESSRISAEEELKNAFTEAGILFQLRDLF